MTTAQKITEIKRLVRIIEAKSGKKLKFEERNTRRKAIKEADEAEINSVVKGLQQINSFIQQKASEIETKFVYGYQRRYIENFINAISSLLSKTLQVATAANTDTGSPAIAEGASIYEAEDDDDSVTMSTDQAVKDPDKLKKLTDKKIRINLTDGDDSLTI